MNVTENQKHLTTIAHELKAPLSAIVNLLAVIDKGYVEDVEKAKELVSRARIKADTVIRMLDDILDYALLQDKTVMKRERIDIMEVIRESISIMRPYMEAKEIQLSACEESCGQMFVNGNYTFLLRAINNLVMNAIKYNRDRGTIEIYCTRPEPEQVTIHIKDSGIGIPEDELKTIFHIFIRGKEARKNVDGSIGLGLSLVQQIIKDHDGSIDITSRVGEGTTVSLTLPLLHVGAL